ncbi:Holliday junction resolvase RuvX [Granulosicoccus antarcticus]|uniref:Putative pre-16S rRNA nuclease n=1 Tax=Granulosicoccus antarcticus IMCC3135 TaxID=1192854 RepID=A0A2Z2NUJ1_9GAMM|nr:Holliday junction resolvase RuvX [Granulosicoccus antarcticus]ASJ71327.1 Putative pre-16S rRNA nuclease [Granulosicoccus antarcticus IMCC3135]
MPDAPTTSGTCLAFDYGSKRIGVAVGETQLQRARPLEVVQNINGTPDWNAINELLQEWQPTDLIVGWPLTEEGLEQAITPHVGGFIKNLKKRYSIPVHKTDERFSSNAAQDVIREQRQSGQRKRKSDHEDIDMVAAALILESWFSLRE